MRLFYILDNIIKIIVRGRAPDVKVITGIQSGPDGLIIVDTMETVEQAGTVLAEFRKISAKPVKAVIYTHNHADHIFGARVFAADGRPDIFAHETTHDLVNRVVSALRPATDTRAMRMFGTFLDDNGLVNVGIGPFLGVGRQKGARGYLPPTVTFKDRLAVERAGIHFELIHAPGETDDQIYVWLPGQRVLICGDNFYWTFPNLYTIRGTPFRSLKQWYQSLDMIRELKPGCLVPCHTRPITGADNIYAIITDYRAAIQFVHDQTLRGINMGMTPAELAGGEDALYAYAEKALIEGRYQAALQLSGHLLRLSPGKSVYEGLRIKALTALGERAENPNARHYYPTETLEIRDHFVARSGAKPSTDMLRQFPLENFFDSLPVYLDPAASQDKDIRAIIRFPNHPTAFFIHVRYGVAEVKQIPAGSVNDRDAELVVTADPLKWKEMLSRVRSPVLTLPLFDYDRGSVVSFARFMKMFVPPAVKLPHAGGE